jgi:hypothetical protein
MGVALLLPVALLVTVAADNVGVPGAVVLGWPIVVGVHWSSS